jgi:hypothetical protein
VNWLLSRYVCGAYLCSGMQDVESDVFVSSVLSLTATIGDLFSHGLIPGAQVLSVLVNAVQAVPMTARKHWRTATRLRMVDDLGGRRMARDSV